MTDGTVRVRAAGLSDLPVLAALHEAAFPEDAWSADALAVLLGGPGSVSSLAWRAGPGGEAGALGFALCRLAGDEAEVLTLCVAPGDRRRGVGRALVESAAALCRGSGARALFLEVAEDNAPARRLYEDTGFAVVGRRPGYYRRVDGHAAAALVCRRPLAGG